MVFASSLVLWAQQPDEAAIARGVDAAVQARFDHILAYTAIEHYAIYRNSDEIHPVAEMTVKASYQRESGKTYTIVSQTGSSILRTMVLGTLLDNEKQINLPSIRQSAWITSSNYQMKLKPGGNQSIDGRECLVLELTPKRKEPHLIQGTLWVDAKDFSIVQLQGVASKSPSILTGPTKMERHYNKVSGYAQAAHARAVSNSGLLGQTIVKIDTSDYQMQMEPEN
jgi:hypothetical protein